MTAKHVPFTLCLWPLAATANIAPTPVIVSAAMRPGTTLMDVVYRVDDPDDATVTVRALAFIDGTRSFAKILRPATFVEGTAANLGTSIPTNAPHTLAWDVAADWKTDVGQVKFEILCRDQRGLLQLDWISIPAAGGQPALTISKDTPSSNKVLDAFFELYAEGASGLSVANGILTGNAASGVFNGVNLANGSTPLGYAVPFIMRKMNLDPTSSSEINYAQVTARAGLLNTTSWHAANRSFGGISCVAGWGATSNGLINIPCAGTPEVMAIAMGQTVAMALKNDGTVLSWGDWTSGMPAALSGVTAIATGAEFCLALKNDGTVVAGGNNSYYQLSVPVDLSGVISIAGGWAHGLAAKNDGTVVGWGYSNNQQLNIPAGLSGVIAVAGGWAHSLALKNNGTVVAWGVNSTGQYAVPSGLSGVTAISAGWIHSLALKSDGTVVAWGSNADGRCAVPPGLSGVIAISAGYDHSMALKSDGTVVAWGKNNFGQTTVPPGLTGIQAIAAGASQSMALRPKSL